MKILSITIVVLSLLAGTAQADLFKVLCEHKGETYYASHADVIAYRGNEAVFKGTTDRYARIQIDLPVGSQLRCVVQWKQHTKQVTLSITGEQQMRTVTAR